MKGIGAKRSLMNYFHYNITQNIQDENKKNNYTCINLDDNITMIGNFTTDCTGRGEAKKRSDSNSFEIPEKLIKCDNMSIYSLYKKLIIDWNTKDELKDMNIIGIQKGGGTQDDKLCINPEDNDSLYCKKSSYSVYKLTLQKPYKIYNNNYQYNPFFTRFLEDMVFNAINQKFIQKSKYYFLRFGHTKPENKDDVDFDDFFHDHLFESFDENIKHITGIEQIYLMNIHYLYYYSNLISSSTIYEKLINKKDVYLLGNDGDTDDAKIFRKYKKGIAINFTKYVSIIMSMSKSKYVHYGLILMMLYLLLKNNKNLQLFPDYKETHKYVCDSIKDNKDNKNILLQDMGFNENIIKDINIDNLYTNINKSKFRKNITILHDIQNLKSCKNNREDCTENYQNIVKNVLLDFGLYKIRNSIGYLDFGIENNNLNFIDSEYNLLLQLFDVNKYEISIDKKNVEKTKIISEYMKNKVNHIRKYTSFSDAENIGENAIKSINVCRNYFDESNINTIFKQKYLKYKQKYLKLKNLF